MTPLRIGVNALYLIPGAVGGTEIYLRALLDALAAIDAHNDYTVFTNAETGRDLLPAGANFRWARQAVHASFRPGRILWEQTELPLECANRRVEVLLNPGFTAPIFAPCPMVTVFHDLQHKRHPENFRWFDLPFWRALLWASAHRSRRLIAVSDVTRDDLLRFYGLPPGKVVVAPQGVDPNFFHIVRRRCSEPYLLAVSTLHPHKNLDTLLRAFAEFHREQPRFRLIIAGLRGFSTEFLEALRGELDLEQAVEFTGWIPRDPLYDLFARAHAFLYPSRFEGFGMPVIEALAAGIPTACSHIEPLASNAGDAALLFDPADRGALVEAMRRVALDESLRARLAEAGPRQAALFSWEQTARITLEAIRQAARTTLP